MVALHGGCLLKTRAGRSAYHTMGRSFVDFETWSV